MQEGELFRKDVIGGDEITCLSFNLIQYQQKRTLLIYKAHYFDEIYGKPNNITISYKMCYIKFHFVSSI